MAILSSKNEAPAKAEAQLLPDMLNELIILKQNIPDCATYKSSQADC
jgi:hypothetical protein